MKTMKRLLVLATAGAALIAATAAGIAQASDGPRVEIWTDRGDGCVYRPGDCARIHLRPHDDCYVMIYEIDTDGYLRVLFPRDRYEDGYLRAGRTYLLGGHRKIYVTGPTGVAYVHVLASYEPFRPLYWNGCDGYGDYAREVSWRGFHDYWGSALPPRVYGDPYTAMETIDEFICGDALEYGLVWADFTYYYVGARVDYPRYLCYDCHGFTTRVGPYSDVCLGFSISFVDYDPCLRPWSWWWWCSPARVYCGPRYVCHATKHYCSKKCGDRCDDKCDTYPSEYKWKSRHEAGGGGAQVVERFRAEDAVGRVAARGGNNVDATRFKQSESRGELDGARGLYSERDGKARSADTGTRGGKVREGTASRATAAAGGSADRGRELLEADRNDRDDEEKADRTRDQKKSEARSERTKSKRGSSEGSIVKRALSSIAGSVVRSKGDSTDDKPKGKAPQVRQQGDKGKSQGTKSQATRRKVSR